MDNPKLIRAAVEALTSALERWQTACIDAKGNPNVEFLAQFELNLDAILKRNPTDCPCTLADEPCNPRCPCVMPHSSHACHCCARHGSLEQRKARANWIVKTLSDARLRALLTAADRAGMGK